MGASCSCQEGGDQLVETVSSKTEASNQPVETVSGKTERVCQGEADEGSRAQVLAAQTDVKVAEEEMQEPGLVISVVAARGLRNADSAPFTGKSDCYCITSLKKQNGKKEKVHRTKTLDNTLDPIWEEEFEAHSAEPADSLEFEVYDEDAVTSTLLGKCVVESKDLEGAGFNQEVLLQEAGQNITAHLWVKVKRAGRDYPVGPLPEFTLTVDKIPGKPVGVDIDIQDVRSAYVVCVKEGPFQTYNKSTTMMRQLKVGDFIVKVNGVQGKGSKLMEQMKQDDSLELVVRRPMELTVAVCRTDTSQRVCEATNHPIGKALLITKINGGSCLAAWNLANPAKEVKAGDRIVAVDGRKGSATDLKKMIEASIVYQITVVRPASSEN